MGRRPTPGAATRRFRVGWRPRPSLGVGRLLSPAMARLEEWSSSAVAVVAPKGARAAKAEQNSAYGSLRSFFFVLRTSYFRLYEATPPQAARRDPGSPVTGRSANARAGSSAACR